MAVKDGLPSTDFSRMNREYIKEVAEGSAGSVLPEIAAADEGKFLGVVSGEAAWATAGGGGGGGSVLLININGLNLDKTGQQIADAYTSGTMCIIVSESIEDGATYIKYSIIIDYEISGSESDGYFYDFIACGFSGSLVATAYSCTNLADYPAIPH